MSESPARSRYIWIPLADGCRLAARLWLPSCEVGVSTPAIFEYHPYRMRDGTGQRDEYNHGYFAQHGYAAVRVDVRGSGDSDGLMGDEYTERELLDGVEIIAWIAAQDWCDGNVGMFGLSWGGFNALQIAARQPPALKAIVTCGSTDDRFADDCHYRGGCLLSEHMGWAATMLSFFSLPPCPELAGEDWRETWLERLEHQPYVLEEWLDHQRRDEFWQHGSVGDQIEKIKVPVLAAGGWMDAYRNAVPRLLANLTVPRSGIVGPWMHRFPHLGVPGPAIGFLQQCVHWWDRWLKGHDNGVTGSGQLHAFIPDASPPSPAPCDKSGRWVCVPTWPPSAQHFETFYLAKDTIAATKPQPERLDVRSPQTTGFQGGELVPMAWGAEAPGDQRADDGNSLVFDTEPLEAPITMLGKARLQLTLESDQPVAHLVGRLCDVSLYGACARVTYGSLNLTHLNGHAHPQALIPGHSYAVTLELDECAYVFPARHRIRLALSTCYWPLIWPVPTAAKLTIVLGDSLLQLPLLPEQLETMVFEAPEMAATAPRRMLRDGRNIRTLQRDLATGEMVSTVIDDAGEQLHEELELITGNVTERVYTINPVDPLSAHMASRRVRIMRNETSGLNVRTVTQTTMSSDIGNFHITAKLEAFDDEVRVFVREWSKSVPRDHA